MVVVICYYICYKYKTTTWYLNGFPNGIVILGQQYNVGEKPTVILYTYINHHAQPPIITQHNHCCSTVTRIVLIMPIIVPWSHTGIGTWVNTFSVLVANRKKLLYTVANPARGLLNRGKKKKKKKVWQRPCQCVCST